MSSNSISLSSSYGMQTREIEHRLNLNAEESLFCISTLSKISAVAIGIIVSLAALTLLGTGLGLTATVLCGVALLVLFNSCCDSSHHHPQPQGRTPPPPYVPWHSRVFSFFPGGGSGSSSGGPNVQVGGGHFPPNPNGRGQNPNVQVGGGHLPQNPNGRGQNPNVQVGGRGRGSNSPPPENPVQPPPPSGPGNHVERGNRRR